MTEITFLETLKLLYSQNGPLLISLFFSAILIILLPALKRRKGLLWYCLALISMVLWFSLAAIQSIPLVFPLPEIWIILIKNILLALFLIFYYTFFTSNYKKGWMPALGLPLIIGTMAILLLYSLPQIYQLTLYRYMRIIIALMPYPWINILGGFFFLILLSRMLVALIRNESFSLLSLIILIPSLALGIYLIWRQKDLKLSPETSLFCNVLPLMMFLSLWRWISPAVSTKHQKEMPDNERLLLQLDQSRGLQEKLEKDLADEDLMLAKVIQKSKKLRDSLAPSRIYPDPHWEAALYYQPENKDEPDYYDFIYSYGRKLKGAVFFDIRNGMNGSFTGAWLKGVLPTQFHEASSLSSLYRQIYQETELFREGRELPCQMLRFNQDDLEYTGWQNAPMLYFNSSRNKAAQLIQDSVKKVDDLKSYRIQIEAGDGVMISNESFYKIPHSITEEPYGTERALQSFSSHRGRATEILQAMLHDRLKFYNGETIKNSGLFVLILKRKDQQT